MEARIKRLFHRKKHISSDHALQHRRGSTKVVQSTPNLGTSLYNSTSPASAPQTDSSRQNRESSPSHHERGKSSSENAPHGMIAASHLQISRHNKRQTSQTIQSDSSADGIGKNGPQQPTKPLNDFSKLNLEDKDITRSVPSHPSRYSETGASGRQNEASSQQPHFSPDAADPWTFSGTSEPAQNMARVPPPELGSQDGHNLLRRVDYNLGSAAKPGSKDDKIRSALAETPNSRSLPYNLTSGRSSVKEPQSTKGASTKQAGRANHGGRPPDRFGNGAEDSTGRILERANNTSIDTEVIETIAPAVVHETVHEDIHHIQREVITREIHQHDVYHRILPIIDVEVLPARHFLPVEGGGLVEISPNEVPGRAQGWVIAETTSKIPSHEPPPKVANRFSAREFVGDEGDSKRYTTLEGFEKTEETWVHPPELETGGRDTGQTWPVVFGNDTGGDGARGLSDSREFSKKKSLRTSNHIPSTVQVQNI